MKITETVERECCEPKDLKKYHGVLKSAHPEADLFFCVHCGEIWDLILVGSKDAKETRFVRYFEQLQFKSETLQLRRGLLSREQLLRDYALAPKIVPRIELSSESLKKLNEMIKSSDLWSDQSLEDNGMLTALHCPHCGHKSAWVYKDHPYIVHCNRKGLCGKETDTLSLFPGIFWEAEAGNSQRTDAA